MYEMTDSHSNPWGLGQEPAKNYGLFYGPFDAIEDSARQKVEEEFEKTRGMARNLILGAISLFILYKVIWS